MPDTAIAPRILLVEDDLLQRGFLVRSIERRFPGAQVRTIQTELDFRTELDDLATTPPDLVIFDVKLPWTRPSQVPVRPPTDWTGSGDAGVRCSRLMRGKGIQSPYLFYTVKTHDELASMGVPNLNQVFLEKSNSTERLIFRMRQILGAGPVLQR